MIERRLGLASPRRAGATLVVLGLIAACVSMFTGPARAAVPAGVSIAPVTATTNLVDAQRVTINVKVGADVPITSLTVRQCRRGDLYRDGFRDDLQPSAGNCPATGVSSSADVVQIRDQPGFFTLARTADGANVNFRVGSGAVAWTAAGGVQSELRCGPADPCVLLVQVRVGGAYSYWTTDLTFVDSNPLAACGGAGPLTLTSAAGDELQDAWSTWTRDFCTTQGSETAPTAMSFGSEGDAVAQFASGEIDLAYTAAGYSAEVGLVAATASKRPMVAVPIALNASVLAVGSGYLQRINGQVLDKSPYGDGELRLTAAEVAALFGGGITWFDRADRPYRAAVLARNPLLNGFAFYGGGSAGTSAALAPSQALSSLWFLSKYLATQSPEHFIAPFETPQVRRGPSANLALAAPSYGGSLSLFTGRPSLQKATDPAAIDTNAEGPLWVFTDRATALALGISTVALENGAGEFVEPTRESMTAAVATMTADEQGLLTPDPAGASGQASSAAAGDAYPLTYVVYAMVPAEALVDESCAPRSASQAVLTDWLEYLVGPGQQNLPAGLAPLPASLLSKAKAAIPTVGAAPFTTVCTGGVASTGSPAAVADFPLASLPLGVPTVPVPFGAALPSNSTAMKNVARIAAIPGFGGSSSGDATGGMVALLGIVLVTSLGVFITSRQNVALDGAGGAAAAGAVGGAAALSTSPQRGVPRMAFLWIAVAIAGFALVLYPLASLFQQQDQASLLSQYRESVRRAANAEEGLPRGDADAALDPPEVGSPVGILEIGDLEVQQVVIEGIAPAETSKGPGHVPGTAGLGQPGNSVVVGRRNSFGGSFGELASLKNGDKIVVTTTQGQSVYTVRSVGDKEIVDRAKPDDDDQVTRDDLFGPSKDDRLTLVTSASRVPWNTSEATVVVAKIRDEPFEPTAQGARTDDQTNLGGDTSSWAQIVLVLVIYAAGIALSVLVYRRFKTRTAYLLTIAPIAALTVITAETLSNLIPSWT